MNNRARMIERARRMRPKKKKLLRILVRIDTTAFEKTLKQAAEAFAKMCNTYAGYIKTIPDDALKKVIEANLQDCSSVIRVKVKEGDQ